MMKNFFGFNKGRNPEQTNPVGNPPTKRKSELQLQLHYKEKEKATQKQKEVPSSSGDPSIRHQNREVDLPLLQPNQIPRDIVKYQSENEWYQQRAEMITQLIKSPVLKDYQQLANFAKKYPQHFSRAIADNQKSIERRQKTNLDLQQEIALHQESMKIYSAAGKYQFLFPKTEQFINLVQEKGNKLEREFRDLQRKNEWDQWTKSVMEKMIEVADSKTPEEGALRYQQLMGFIEKTSQIQQDIVHRQSENEWYQQRVEMITQLIKSPVLKDYQQLANFAKKYPQHFSRAIADNQKSIEHRQKTNLDLQQEIALHQESMKIYSAAGKNQPLSPKTEQFINSVQEEGNKLERETRDLQRKKEWDQWTKTVMEKMIEVANSKTPEEGALRHQQLVEFIEKTSLYMQENIPYIQAHIKRHEREFRDLQSNFDDLQSEKNGSSGKLE